MGIPTPVTASFGVACFQGGKETLEELVHAADQRLYRAKQAGRNRVCGPDPP
jgi:diguanylate cyclase (GGDEF)-like protein